MSDLMHCLQTLHHMMINGVPYANVGNQLPVPENAAGPVN